MFTLAVGQSKQNLWVLFTPYMYSRMGTLERARLISNAYRVYSPSADESPREDVTRTQSILKCSDVRALPEIIYYVQRRVSQTNWFSL